MSNENGFCLKMVPCECDSGNGGSMKLPDLSYDEQYAGFNDLDGSKVYVRTFKLTDLPTSTSKVYKHGITNVKAIVEAKGVARSNSAKGRTYSINSVLSHDHTYGAIISAVIETEDIYIYTATGWSDFTGYLTIYYTCTDR